MIGPEVEIGSGCKIQNNVSVYLGVTLEEDVFCGPAMMFTNIYNPRAHINRMDQVRPTRVCKGATLWASSCSLFPALRPSQITKDLFQFYMKIAVYSKAEPDRKPLSHIALYSKGKYRI
jgi:hypothetical protein